MAEGHGWGGAPPWGFNHPALASASVAPSLSKSYLKEGTFSRTYVTVYRLAVLDLR